MGMLPELNNRQSLLKIVEKLPFYLKKEWLKKVHSIRSRERRLPTIDDILLMVSAAAERANDPVFGKLLASDKPRKESKPKEGRGDKRRSNFNIQAHPSRPCAPYQAVG